MLSSCAKFVGEPLFDADHHLWGIYPQSHVVHVAHRAGRAPLFCDEAIATAEVEVDKMLRDAAADRNPLARPNAVSVDDPLEE